MIIFYNKKTGEIFGTVDGRVHSKEEIRNSLIKPKSLDKEDVGKYVVPFKAKFRIEEQPVTEMRVVDKETMRVEEVVVGKKKVKVGAGMEPDVPFASLISNFENRKENIYDYKAKLNSGKELIGFEKKDK